MSYNYNTFQKALAIEMAVPNNDPTDVQFVAILPTLIDQAEQRIYRELDLLAATIVQIFPMIPQQGGQSYNFSACIDPIGVTQQILIPERVFLIIPPLTQNAGGYPLIPVSVDYAYEVTSGIYPNPGPVGPPKYFAPVTDTILYFAPIPDQAYLFEIDGKGRPIPLYNAPPGDGTQTTFLTSVLPDLFLAAAMCAATGYQHNWGAQADDPRSAMSWETTYQGLLGPARGEEMRKKYHGWMGMTAEINAAPSQPGTPGPP